MPRMRRKSCALTRALTDPFKECRNAAQKQNPRPYRMNLHPLLEECRVMCIHTPELVRDDEAGDTSCASSSKHVSLFVGVICQLSSSDPDKPNRLGALWTFESGTRDVQVLNRMTGSE